MFLPTPATGIQGRQLIVGAALLAAMPVSWLLFGWKVEDRAGLGLITERRSFGRVTLRTIDSDRDGSVDGRYRYSWTLPADSAGARPHSYEEDRDRDGRMDVWVEDLGPNVDGDREWRFDVDTDADGRPDWSFKSLDTLSGDEAILELRGW